MKNNPEVARISKVCFCASHPAAKDPTEQFACVCVCVMHRDTDGITLTVVYVYLFIYFPCFSRDAFI